MVADVTGVSETAATLRHTATNASATGRLIQLLSGSHHPDLC
jgi:hypothetical protein